MSVDPHREDLERFIEYCLDRHIQDEQLLRLLLWKFAQELHRLEEPIAPVLYELTEESESLIEAGESRGSGL